MFTHLFWKDTAERVIRTAAAVTAGVLTAGAADELDLGDFSTWLYGVIIPTLVTLCLALVSSGRSNTISPASAVQVTPPEVPAHDPENPE